MNLVTLAIVRNQSMNDSVYLMMMMMNCFRKVADWQNSFSLIFSRGHYQRSSPSRISDTSQAGFETAQNLSSHFVEWNCAAVITLCHTTRLPHCTFLLGQSYLKGRCLFCLGWLPFWWWCHDKNALWGRCFTLTSFTHYLFLLDWLKLNLAILLDQLRLAWGDECWW